MCRLILPVSNLTFYLTFLGKLYQDHFSDTFENFFVCHIAICIYFIS